MNSLTDDSSPVTTSAGEEKIHYTREATILAAVCASVFTLVGVAGNSLTVVALLRCPKLRSHATTMFVISLAASDLLFSSVNLPLTAARYVHEEWKLGDTMCRLFPFFFYGNVAASLMNMVAITINRYVLIGYHANYNRIYTRRNIFLMIATVWLFSFGMMVPSLAEVWGSMGYDKRSFSCTILKKNGSSPKKFLMVFGFLLPCLAIIACYSAIFIKVRQSRRNVQAHSGSAKPTKPSGDAKLTRSAAATSQQKRDEMRLTKMMLTIFLCFLVCFLPLMLVNVADDDVRRPFLHIVASVLAWASAIVNPFIYAFRNRQYQQAFAKIVCVQAVSRWARGVLNRLRLNRTDAEDGVRNGTGPKSQPAADNNSKTSTAGRSSSRTVFTDTVAQGHDGSAADAEIGIEMQSSKCVFKAGDHPANGDPK